MTIKAVCIGINKYHDSPLHGCVNDVMDMYAFLTEKAGVPKDNVRLLLDERATADGIKSRAAWLKEGVTAGDHLIFHFSGHGTRIRKWCGSVLDTRLESCLVPIDFDWGHESRFISNQDLTEAFGLGRLPAGVDLTLVFDVCHAGGMKDREFGVGSLSGTVFASREREERMRFLAPPLDIEMRHRNRELPEMKLVSWLQPNFEGHHRVLAACQENQTAADSTFGMNARPNGAFTWSLLQSLHLGEGRTWLQVMEDARKFLKDDGFAQVPVLRAQPAAINSYPLH